MTLEGCLLFNPCVYLANRKCGDLGRVSQERFSAEVVAGFNGLLILWLQAQSLYHVSLTHVF